MDKKSKISVSNRNNGTTGYEIPELKVRRQFAPGESKDIEYGELEQLTYIPGGLYILNNLLKIENEEVIAELLGEVEPEYQYNKDDIEKLLKEGSLDALKDCLDFAPTGVIEQVKDIAVNLPLKDIDKIEAIREKTGLDVAKAVEIKNMKLDGETIEEAPKRRVATASTKAQRRVVID